MYKYALLQVRAASRQAAAIPSTSHESHRDRVRPLALLALRHKEEIEQEEKQDPFLLRTLATRQQHQPPPPSPPVDGRGRPFLPPSPPPLETTPTDPNPSCSRRETTCTPRSSALAHTHTHNGLTQSNPRKFCPFFSTFLGQRGIVIMQCKEKFVRRRPAAHCVAMMMMMSLTAAISSLFLCPFPFVTGNLVVAPSPLIPLSTYVVLGR